MVAEAPEQLRDDALVFFRAEDLPDSLRWVEDLTPLQVRLFAVELSDALKDCLITGDYRQLVVVIEGWEATAEVMSSPEIMAEIARPADLRAYRPLSDFTE